MASRRPATTRRQVTTRCQPLHSETTLPTPPLRNNAANPSTQKQRCQPLHSGTTLPTPPLTNNALKPSTQKQRCQPLHSETTLPCRFLACAWQTGQV
eukprot:94739-Chlamydomonas_euryale.AAC.1